MKNYLLLLFPLVMLSACLSENEGDLVPDCSETDLALKETTVVNATCETPGSVTMEASGGTPGYEFSTDGTNFQQDAQITGLSAGTYMVTVKDGSDCTASISVNVGAEDGGVIADVQSTADAGCGESNGSVTLTASGGQGSFTYQIDEGEFTSSATFSNLAAGEHIYVAKDANGCTDEGVVTLLAGTSLEGDIMPIILNNCATSSSCHATGASGRPVLETKSVVISKASNIAGRTSNGSMPPTGAGELTQAQIDLISCWFEDGAADN